MVGVYHRWASKSSGTSSSTTSSASSTAAATPADPGRRRRLLRPPAPDVGRRHASRRRPPAAARRREAVRGSRLGQRPGLARLPGRGGSACRLGVARHAPSAAPAPLGRPGRRRSWAAIGLQAARALTAASLRRSGAEPHSRGEAWGPVGGPLGPGRRPSLLRTLSPDGFRGNRAHVLSSLSNSADGRVRSTGAANAWLLWRRLWQHAVKSRREPPPLRPAGRPAAKTSVNQGVKTRMPPP